MKVPYIYIASPYSHEDKDVRDRRVRQASRYAAILFERGLACYSPIAHWAPIADMFELGHGIDKFWKQDEALLANARCLHVLQLPGWDVSVGVKTEIDYAKDNGIPIIHIETDDLP